MQERLKKMLEEAREQLSAANTEKEAEEIRIRFWAKRVKLQKYCVRWASLLQRRRRNSVRLQTK